MSNTRVAETVWPWRTAGEAQQASKSAPSVRGRALIEAAVMVSVALLFIYKTDKVWPPRIILTLATLTLVSGLFIPPLYHSLHRGALWLGKKTGVVMTWILLVPFFFIIFPAARLMLLLSGKDPLHRKIEPQRPSYWTAHEPVKDLERYKRQF